MTRTGAKSAGSVQRKGGYSLEPNTIYTGDCLPILHGWPDGCIDCIVTSPPYWGLRDYGAEGQLGLEPTIAEYVDKLVLIFRECRRVLKDSGTCWLNLGDSYAGGNCRWGGQENCNDKQKTNAGTMFMGRNAIIPPGLKPKDLCLIPARVALALQADGWYLRSDIIWAKPNPMPESCKDRPTSAYEHVFLLTKQARYWYDADAIAEGLSESTIRIHSSGGVRPYGTGGDWKQYHVGNGHSGLVNGNLRDGTRNARNVWTIATHPFPDAHFATFPPELPRRCTLAGCPEGGVVLDPFMGSGTTGMVAEQLGRQWVGIELSPEYAAMARKRTAQRGLFSAD